MNQSDTAAFVLINPKQVQRAELTLGHFLTKLTGPIARSILSRSPFDELPGMIGKICKVIREKIMQFARACGLVRSIRCYEETSWNFTSNDWFTESLVQGSRLLSDLVRLEEEIWFNVDRYFDTHNVNLHESNVSSKRVKSSANEDRSLRQIDIRAVSEASSRKKKRTPLSASGVPVSEIVDARDGGRLPVPGRRKRRHWIQRAIIPMFAVDESRKKETVILRPQPGSRELGGGLAGRRRAVVQVQIRSSLLPLDDE